MAEEQQEQQPQEQQQQQQPQPLTTQQVFQWITSTVQSPEDMYTTGNKKLPSWKGNYYGPFGVSYNPETGIIVHGKTAIDKIGLSMRVWIMCVSQKWPEFIGIQNGQSTNPAQNLSITCAAMEFQDDRPGISWMFDRVPMGNVTELTRKRIERQLRNCYREIAYGEDGTENQDMIKMIEETVELHVLSLAN